MDANANTGLTVASHGGGHFDIRGVEPREVEILMGSVMGGHHWVRRGKDGRLESVPSYEPLPAPTKDEEMEPYWPQAEKGTQLEMFCLGESGSFSRHTSASIIIQSLCGYNYTPKAYNEQAQILTSWGFECLRSRRGPSGGYWELWYLPGMWAAKGELHEAVFDSKKKNEKLKTAVAVEFIRERASFGTLDISVQRLCQVLEDASD